MNPTVGLVVFLVLYALMGAAFAFNVQGVSDRAAAAYVGKPWLLRQIGRDNPAVWRAGGFMMAVSGVAIIAGILLVDVFNPPGINVTTAIAILIAVGVVSLVMLVRPKRPHHPPEPPEGR